MNITDMTGGEALQLVKGMQEKVADLECLVFAETNAKQAALDQVAALEAEKAARQQAVPSVCDGKEQGAFEAWGEKQGMNMDTHPLHWLFLGASTASARAGWKGAIEYCQTMLSAAPTPAERVEQEPFWYAVISDIAPVINKAIRSLDVAQEYAEKCSTNYQGVRVVPLYATPHPSTDTEFTTQKILDMILSECKYWHGRNEAVRGNFAILYAKAKEVADKAQSAPAAPDAAALVEAAVIARKWLGRSEEILTREVTKMAETIVALATFHREG